jgi:hypothetical protein
MGIHSESVCAKDTALEGEMRRRLWWSLVLFDSRIGELAGSRATTLAPTWDCRIPLNMNDYDLRKEMKEPAIVHGTSTEALFAVVRAELGEYIRHTMFHLDFTGPALKPVAKAVQNGPVPNGGELVALENMIENKYLKFCDSEIPLHFMTIWTTRGYLSRCRLMEHYSKFSGSSVQTDVQSDAAISHALSMLDSDTKVINSSLTKGYRWLVHMYFPFVAYIHITQDLRRRPVSIRTKEAWQVMSDNYNARFGVLNGKGLSIDSPIFQLFAKIVLNAWDAREAAFLDSKETLVLPEIVSSIKHKVAQSKSQHGQNLDTEQYSGGMGLGTDDFLTLMPVDFGTHSLFYRMEGHNGCAAAGSGTHASFSGQDPPDIDMNQLDWAAMDWSLADTLAGEAEEWRGPSPRVPTASSGPARGS